MPSLLRVRSARCPAAALCVLLATALAVAGDADPGAILPEDAIVSVRLAASDDVRRHPLVARIFEAAYSSPELARRWDAAAADPRAAGLLALAERLQLEPADLLAKLTAGGAALGVTEEQLLAVFVTDDENLPARIAAELRRLAEEAAPDAADTFRSERSGAFECHCIGPVRLAAGGRWLLVASTDEALSEAIDRCGGQPPAGGAAAESPGARPFVTAELNLAELRSRQTEFADALAIPASDTPRTAFLGGWLDLLRRHDRATLEISPRGDRLHIDLRVAAAKDGDTAWAVPGFFAEENDGQPAPLLSVPGTIYAASWYRDLSTLWEARRNLLTAEAADKLEAGNEQAATQLEVFGTHLRPSDLITQFGPHFRVVLAEQEQAPYGVKALDRLPAAALAFDLRDEQQVREMTAPILRTLHLIMSGENRMLTSEHEYQGAKLVRLSLSEDPAEQQRGSSVRYNFRTTYAFTRGHFVVGTTQQIVERVIDALDREAAERPAVPVGVTELQQLDLARVGDAVRALRDGIARGLVLNSGWDLEDAEREIDVWTDLLSSLGRVETSAGFEGDGFRYQVTVGPESFNP